MTPIPSLLLVKRFSFYDLFEALASRFGLKGKVKLYQDWQYREEEGITVHRFTLFPVITDESERDSSVPSEFVNKVQELVYWSYGYTPHRPKTPLVFSLASGQTPEEIEQAKLKLNQYYLRSMGEK